MLSDVSFTRDLSGTIAASWGAHIFYTLTLNKTKVAVGLASGGHSLCTHSQYKFANPAVHPAAADQALLCASWQQAPWPALTRRPTAGSANQESSARTPEADREQVVGESASVA